MKIIISEKEKEPFSIKLPHRLLFNTFSASLFPLFINKRLKKSGIKITGKMCRKFVRGFYKTRNHFGGKINLVDIETKDGIFVKIII